MATVNLVQLRRELSQQEARIIAPRMKEILNDKFVKEKENLLIEFDNHPVTVELNEGPSAKSNIIDTAKGGNLFSFFGFDSKVEPAKEIRRVLDNKITKGHVRRESRGGDKLVYTLETRIPTLQELNSQGQLVKWTTRSFLDMVEKGISNFKHYLFDDSGRLKKYSRSGTAIQVKGNIRASREDAVKPIPYVTKMIQDFMANLRNFNR